jgi:starch phosphorylase
MKKIFETKEEFIEAYRRMIEAEVGKSFEEADDYERLAGLCNLVAFRARSIHAHNDEEIVEKDKKRVFYFSLEFLIGPLLENYLLNFGVLDLVRESMVDLGTTLEEVSSCEVDPGLGNGGLGRLAACFLDSMAREGIAGYGNGMRYKYGLFRQTIEDGRQVEKTDNWLAHGYPWEVCRPESAVQVTFGGEVVRHSDGDKYWFTLEGGETVNAVPYDVPVIGYGGKTVNKLRLWSAEPIEEDFDLDAFNSGDYAKASKFRTDVEAISTILYPNDSGEHGRILRLKQEYLFVAAGIGSIIRTFKKDYGTDWEKFPEVIAIHTNDTHPAMCGAELMRVLIDEEGLDWDTAWNIVTSTISYTNHTVLPEALEKWPIDTFRELLPRVYMYIEEIDRRYRESFPKDHPNWQEQLKKTAILWDGQVRMANLSIICAHSVNGVARIHTDILVREVLKDFAELTPEKFNNKTNGISQRRFLGNANPTYTRLINDAIGDGWLADATELKKLEAFYDDAAFLDGMAASKKANKERLAAYIAKETGVVLDTDSVFDVQVKRFHAYKRQLLNIFKVMDVYNRLLSDPNYKPRPTSFIFAGKAAQSYTYAKEVIRLINSVADVVNNDERVNDIIKVAFVPNFAVSNAELIYPAAEISEQISTAGMEASGTSNMKLMMNGAITLGTLDGANVEIAQLAGLDNIKIFGLTVEEVEALKNGYYFAWDEYNNDRDRLGRVVDELIDGTFAGLSGNFNMIYDGLMHQNDADFVLRDFRPYVSAWEELGVTYGDQRTWNRMALANTANSGYFSSDRTIVEYAKDIWHCM